MKKVKRITILSLILILIFIIFFLFITLVITINMNTKISDKYEEKLANINLNTQNETENQNSELKDTEIKKISKLDLIFLKLENQEKNKIYSPLSIKYALKMLEEATTGESKEQISKLINNEVLTLYNSNNNMSFANALFIRDLKKDTVSQNYINKLKTNYNAEVIFDSFSTPENVNLWISNKTFNLINNLVENIDEKENYMLINSLAIDMEWKNKFSGLIDWECNYKHENFYWDASEFVLPMSNTFNKNKELVSGMKIIASINNYDILTELGEENIRKTVSDEFRTYLKTDYGWKDYKQFYYKNYEYNYNGYPTDEEIEKHLNEYLDGGLVYSDDSVSIGYIEELNSNYKRVDYSTDFSLYVDENVKAFSKDLKESNGTTLQYVGIMPTTEDLDSYINDLNENKINNIVSRLKDLKSENFKEGVVTKITGYIPKFNFDYELNLKEDLKNLGVKNVFEEGSANLTELSNNKIDYISKAIHKANIEFTQDGIKAAAASFIGGGGGGSYFDYIYEIPIEEIDLTFDKPYMFLIRDKETGEIWFIGTVYEPLLWENETGKESIYSFDFSKNLN